MNKTISWKVLLPVGLVLSLIGRLMGEGVIFSGIGILGDILFLVGFINMIIALVKRNRGPQPPPPVTPV